MNRKSKKEEVNFIREVYKRKSEWKGNRGIGGSSASAILNANPYMSLLDLYWLLVSPYKETPDNQNDATIYGTKCEPLIRKQFELDFPEYKVHCPYYFEMYRRKDKPFMTATLDGLLIHILTNRKGILEIKTHDIRNKEDEENWNGKMPQNYFIQCLHYLVVRQDCDFVILCAKLRYFDYYHIDGKKLLYQKIVCYRIERSEVQDQIDYLELKETEFWYNYVVPHKIPNIYITF